MTKAKTESNYQDLLQLTLSTALELGDPILGITERANAAHRLRALVSALLQSKAMVEGGEWPASLCSIVEEITKAILSLLELGDTITFADVKEKLDIACDLMGALDEISRSDAIALEDKLPILENVEALVNPALRTLVRLVDPDRVEYCLVGDQEVRIGSLAMSLAWRSSAIVHDKSRMLRDAGVAVNQ